MFKCHRYFTFRWTCTTLMGFSLSIVLDFHLFRLTASLFNELEATSMPDAPLRP